MTRNRYPRPNLTSAWSGARSIWKRVVTHHIMANAQLQEQAWHDDQVECAICLCRLREGLTVRVYRVSHLSHLDGSDDGE